MSRIAEFFGLYRQTDQTQWNKSNDIFFYSVKGGWEMLDLATGILGSTPVRTADDIILTTVGVAQIGERSETWKQTIATCRSAR